MTEPTFFFLDNPLGAELCHHLHRQSFAAPAIWSLRTFEGLLALDNCRAIIGQIDDDPFGLLLLQRVLDEVEVLTFCVVPSYRRRGLGRKFFQKVEDHFIAEGVSRCHLEVAASNVAARALYLPFDFIEQGRRKGYYTGVGNEREDAILMVKSYVDLPLHLSDSVGT